MLLVMLVAMQSVDGTLDGRTMRAAASTTTMSLVPSPSFLSVPACRCARRPRLPRVYRQLVGRSYRSSSSSSRRRQAHPELVTVVHFQGRVSAAVCDLSASGPAAARVQHLLPHWQLQQQQEAGAS
jgi:hypothetical protein